MNVCFSYNTLNRLEYSVPYLTKESLKRLDRSAISNQEWTYQYKKHINNGSIIKQILVKSHELLGLLELQTIVCLTAEYPVTLE